MLPAEDRIELLRLARLSLESYLSKGSIPHYESSRPELNAQHGAFVSLHRGEDLRGCIGQLVADRELYRIVQHCAISAATEDMRFDPVRAGELPEITIEISVLTPFHRMSAVQEIEIGKHGIFVSRGRNRGLLLPQVATHYKWDCQTFLRQTCHKAGLPSDAWKDPATSVQLFEAEIFSD